MSVFRRLLLTSALALLPLTLYAQNLDWAEPSSGGGEAAEEASGPGLPTDPVAVPLDGGLTLLGAAGAAYAVNRLRQRRKEKRGH